MIRFGGLTFVLAVGCVSDLDALEGAANTMARTVDTGGMALQPTSDQCPTDPNKEEPGLCGCEFIDPVPVERNTCVHSSATVLGTLGADVTVLADVRVEAGASVEDGATLRAGATIATRAQIGANTTIGADTVVGRRAIVGARTTLGAEPSSAEVPRSVTM